ncbi:putative MFS family arabinose efflux permease [Stella humosa]|uniref:Putative MFS family arabinose efflux permease n=1 Tax=Stella humosa TaxID=94 RepID=A0A3N1KX41_9PROT|nr:MFS transporter [Stella humosa]ROP84052.1 putative MFS family arabinose efflux permease [Stella humosa]BBK33563.1 tetracycline resistance MFS efflux pump [Stella humosa]
MPVLFLIVFVDLVGFGIVIPLLPYYALHFQAGPEVVTMVMASYSLAQLVTAPLWGRLSDRIGRRPVLLMSLAGSVASYLALAWAPSLLVLFLARIAAGAMAGNIAAAQAYVADVTTPERRAQGMGLIGAAFGLGFILGPAIGGVLAGHDPHDVDFTMPALTAAGLSAAAFVGTLLVLRESLDRSRPPAPRISRLVAIRQVLGRPGIARFILVGFATISVFAGMETTFALWSSSTFGWGPAQNGYLFAFVGILGALLQGVAIGRLTRRFGELRLLAAGLVLIGAGLAGLGFTTTVPMLFATASLLGLGFGLANPSLASLVSRSADPADQGMVLGVHQSAGSLARVVGPLVAGVAFAHLGPPSPFLLGAAIILPVAVFAARMARR